MLQGKYPCSDEDVVKLSGMQLQSFWGDQSNPKEFVKQFAPELTVYIPPHLLDHRTKEEWLADMSEMHLDMIGTPKDRAKHMYIDFIKDRFPVYGATFFHVKGFGDLSQQNIVLAINWKGIFVLDKDSRNILHQYDHNQINMCSYSSTRFSIVISERKKERKISFATPMVKRCLFYSESREQRWTLSFESTVPSTARTTAKVPRKKCRRMTQILSCEIPPSTVCRNPHSRVSVGIPPHVDESKFRFTDYTAEHLRLEVTLKYRLDGLDDPLHKDAEFDEPTNRKEAMDSFLHIQKIMGDQRKKMAASPREIAQLIQTLVARVLKKAILRNEVIIQIIHQITGHPIQ